MSVDQKSTKIVTGVVRLSYAKIWEPEADDKGVMKYSTSILIPKSDKKTIADIKNAIEAAKLAGKDKLGRKGGVVKLPLRDGDEERPDDEAYAGYYFLNASTTQKPGIVDRAVKPIMDRDEVYSGCYVRASLNFYAFNVGANKGIAVGNILNLSLVLPAMLFNPLFKVMFCLKFNCLSNINTFCLLKISKFP